MQAGARERIAGCLMVSLAADSPEHHTNQQSKEGTAQGSRAGTQEDPLLAAGIGLNQQQQGEGKKRRVLKG